MSEIDLWRAIRELERELDQIRALSRLPYSKSTYAPTYTGTTTAGATTYTTQVGAWVRIGSLVGVYGRLTWTAATGTGTAQITLPVAARGDITGLRPAATVWINSVTFAGSWIEALLPEGSATFLLYTTTSNAAVAGVPVEAAGDLAFNITYFAV